MVGEHGELFMEIFELSSIEKKNSFSGMAEMELKRMLLAFFISMPRFVVRLILSKEISVIGCSGNPIISIA